MVQRAITSHLQTYGCTVVKGIDVVRVNTMVYTLALFLSPADRRCSRLASDDAQYVPSLLLQGLRSVDPPKGELLIRSAWPTTIVDVDQETVVQGGDLGEHRLLRDDYFRMAQECLRHPQLEAWVAPSDMMHSVRQPAPLVVSFTTHVQEVQPLFLRDVSVAHFMCLLRRRAVAVVRYVEALESDEGAGALPHQPHLLRRLRSTFGLTSEADWRIVLAAAEKLCPRFYFRVYGGDAEAGPDAADADADAGHIAQAFRAF